MRAGYGKPGVLVGATSDFACIDDVPGEPLSDEDREKLLLWWRECGITPPPEGKIIYYSTRFKP